MMSDANLVNLGSGSPQPGRHPARVVDLVGSSKGESCSLEKSSIKASPDDKGQTFAQVYREVAKANKAAHQAAIERTGQEGDGRNPETGCKAPSMSSDQCKSKEGQESLGGDQGEAVEKELVELINQIMPTGDLPAAGEPNGEDLVVSQDGTTVAEQATLIIKTSLIKVSEMLNMKLVDGIDELKISSPSDELIGQFAEIVHTLEQIAKILVEAINQNQPVELGAKQLSPQNLVSIEKTLRVEIFHLQVAFKMLGVSTEVAGNLAQKQDASIGMGIPQAADPASLSMPANQIQQVFSELIASREGELRTLLTQVAAVLKQEMGQKLEIVQAGGQTPQNQGANVVQQMASISTGSASSSPAAVTPEVQAAINRMLLQAGVTQNDVSSSVVLGGDQSQQQSQSVKSLLQISAFDATIMRRLLRIDSSAATAAGNQEAATQLEKLDLPKASGLLLGRNPVDLAQRGENMQMPVLDVLAKHGSSEALSALMGPRLGDLVMRNIEQTVMSQIIEKFNLAVRTGVNEMRLVLHPESLGEVRVKIEIHQDVVHAKIQVESQQVKQIVENNLQSLKNALQEHHLQTGSLSVSVGDGSSRRYVDGKEDGSRGKDGSEEDSADDAATDEATVTMGVETGRRYGGNSVEFFA